MNGRQPCIFPFIFNGVTYNGCPTLEHTLGLDINNLIPYNTRWCSTKVDKNGNHINAGQGNFHLPPYNWGICDSSCPNSNTPFIKIEKLNY